jgi:hypothetical protein
MKDYKLECLKLAVASYAHFTPSREDIVSSARAYADFVLGTNDSEIIAAAQSLAKKINASSV